MQWAVTTPPAKPVIWPQDLIYFLRIEPDTAATGDETELVAGIVAAAVEYAEAVTGCSLITRTITATFYPGDQLHLPRGPVSALTSVTDAGNAVQGCTLERRGNTDVLKMPGGWAGPLSVVYTAGYGPDPSDVPASIRQAIKVHCGTLYENRESVSKAFKAMAVIPHSLEAFYGLKSRTSLIG